MKAAHKPNTATRIHQPLENLNIAALDLMPSPEEIHARVPISDKASKTVFDGRETIKEILDRKDPRLFIVVGPCSIHDPIAGYDYAQRLKNLADEVRDTLYLVMRVYFEKPRTSVGWKGFINDPRMDDSFHIEEGMEKARAFLLQVTELGLPAATEALDPIAPQYLGDLISWAAIGARTSESQTHREMASGLSTPVGFKNGTDGNIEVAINAVKSSAKPHSFLGINTKGRSSIVRTRGNAYAARRQVRAQHRRRLLPLQFLQGSQHAGARDVGLRAPDPRRQPIDRRADGREQHRRRQPTDPRRSFQAEIWLLGYRSLHRLADYRHDHPKGPRYSQGHPGATGKIDCYSHP